MKKIIIAAVAENGVIGINGRLPWELKSDLEFFKSVTYGYPVFMGFKTFQTLKKPLTGRINIIISSKKLGNFDNVYFFDSIEKGLIFAETLNNEKLFIIGGGKIFKQTIDLADVLIISKIKRTYFGDTFFPQIDKNYWELYNKENRIEFEIEYYKKRNT